MQISDLEVQHFRARWYTYGTHLLPQTLIYHHSFQPFPTTAKRRPSSIHSSIHPSKRIPTHKASKEIGLHRTLPTTPDPVLQTESVKQRAGYLKGYKGC